MIAQKILTQNKMKKNSQNAKNKVVFLLDANSQDRETILTPDTYKYVNTMLEVMLRRNEISSETIYIGGLKHDLVMWLSGILEFYLVQSIEITNMTSECENDPDFVAIEKKN